MSKKQIGIIPNNGDVHTAANWGSYRTGWRLRVRPGNIGNISWFVVPGVSVDAVNGYRPLDIEAKILFVGIGIRFIWIKRKVKR